MPSNRRRARVSLPGHWPAVHAEQVGHGGGEVDLVHQHPECWQHSNDKNIWMAKLSWAESIRARRRRNGSGCPVLSTSSSPVRGCSPPLVRNSCCTASATRRSTRSPSGPSSPGARSTPTLPRQTRALLRCPGRRTPYRQRPPPTTRAEALHGFARAWLASVPIGSSRGWAATLLPEVMADEFTRVPFSQLVRLSAILLGLALERLEPGVGRQVAWRNRSSWSSTAPASSPRTPTSST